METFFIHSPPKRNRHPRRWFGGEKTKGEDRDLPPQCFSDLLILFWILPIFIQMHVHPLSLKVNLLSPFSILHLRLWLWLWFFLFCFMFRSILIRILLNLCSPVELWDWLHFSDGLLWAIDFVFVNNFVNFHIETLIEVWLPNMHLGDSVFARQQFVFFFFFFFILGYGVYVMGILYLC